MSPETAINIVKKYAAKYGVRKTARLFKINKSTVSRAFNNVGSISGKRIAAKVAAAGTMTCPELKVMMLPEICLEIRAEVVGKHPYTIKKEYREILYRKCDECKIGEALCLTKK